MSVSSGDGVEPVKFNLFGNVHPQGAALVLKWHTAARDKKSIPEPESFGRFIELWLAFNNWAMRVTEADTDAAMIRALSDSPSLNEAFKALLNTDQIFKHTALRFSEYWPVFDVKDLHKKGLRHKLSHLPRNEYVARLLEAHVKHRPDGLFNKQSPTWKQVIETIYTVRCNLFHGEKGDASDDTGIVSGAFDTLLDFIDGVNLYQWRNPGG